MRALVRSIVVPVACFAALATIWTWPLALHLSTRLPGELAGDNLGFTWNLWWMRQAGTGFFATDHLFAPFGIDLALHTHTALQGVVGATLLARFDIFTAQNLVVLATLTLNGVAAYALALERTRQVVPSLVAGLIYASSAYVTTHLLGHFSLIGTWTLPLYVLCLLRTLEGPSRAWAVATGLALAATAWTDYYYAVYCVVLTVGAVLIGVGGPEGGHAPLITLDRRDVAPRVRRSLFAVMALLLTIGLAIVVTGGVDTTVAGVRIRATDTHNLFTGVWIVAAVYGWLRFRPRVRLHLGARLPGINARVLRLWPAAVVALVALLPILSHAVRVIVAGDYSAPAHQWRSGPAGVDVLTLLLGNPFHPLTGAWTSAAYTRLGLDRTEGMGWLGVVPTGVLLWSAREAWRTRQLSRTLGASLFFFVWALGPWLKVATLDTGLILPANLFGLVPILSNARMPGRAVVVAVLGASLLAARMLAALPRPQMRRLAGAGAVLVCVDLVPVPFPLLDVDATPHLYTTLASMPDGAVCELPMGLRDGFEQIGAFDDRTLQFQFVHGHPLVGGFAARIPDSLKRRYANQPLVRSLLALSAPAGGTLEPTDEALTREQAVDALRAAGIRYIVLDRTRASQALQAVVDSRLPLTLVERNGTRDLFTVSGSEHN